MITDLCTDDVVVHINGPQILSTGGIVETESLVTTSAGTGSRCGAGVGAGAGGGAELGRRLLVAARAGDTRAVLDLMAKGAPFTTDWLGTSALHLAAGAGHADTCAVLARAGVSRDARTKVERTPLHLAAYAGHTAVVELLLDLGAAIDCRDMLRMSPLQWAAARGHGATAAALVRHGADISLVDKFGHTARALAARRGHQHVVRALDDAARAREAQRSVRALQADQMPEIRTTDAQIRSFETVQKISDETTLKQNRSQQERNATIKTEPVTDTSEEPQAEGAAAQLLRKHGITLLPADDGSTVLNAIQSGRTVVLSDAGKLMLKESDSLATLSRVTSSAAPVLLAAAPVRSPASRPGLKVFTLNNKLLLPTQAQAQAPNDLQVKFVQLPADGKLASPVKTIPMKAKTKAAAGVGGAGGARPAVKIIMNKANFNKLLANATTTLVSHTADAQTAKSTSAMRTESGGAGAAGAGCAADVAEVADVCAVSEAAVATLPAAALRALLARALRELRDARAALAQHAPHAPHTTHTTRR